MNIQGRRYARRLAFSALCLGLIGGSPVVLGTAVAQTAIVDPNAAQDGMSAHDAALAAARRGDYLGALELSKKAAAEGQALEADQVEFISEKATKQQAAAADNAALKAKQEAASATADQILARQQKEAAARSKPQAAECPSSGRIGVFTSAAGGAASGGSGALGGNGGKVTGAGGKCGK